MRVTRRTALGRMLPGAALCGGFFPWPAHAQDQYIYDVRGRVTQVLYANGARMLFVYDGANNRVAALSAPAGTFAAFVDVVGSAPVDLRALANAAGYNGAQDASLLFVIQQATTIAGTANGGIAIDSGAWPGGFTTNLLLVVLGKIHGGGGGGGAGGSSNGAGAAGGTGGDALYCRAPMSIIVKTGGEIRAGGGGGGGGAGAQFYAPPIGWQTKGGGGGGGGFPNGAGGSAGTGSNGNGLPGSPGTTAGGGAGGQGGGPPGGVGGNAAGAGANGGNGSSASGGAGGAAGYAVRKNSHVVSVTNSGAISGVVD